MAPARAGELVFADDDDSDAVGAATDGGGDRESPRVRFVTQEEAAAESVPASRVVLPLPGRFSEYPLEPATLRAYDTLSPNAHPRNPKPCSA